MSQIQVRGWKCLVCGGSSVLYHYGVRVCRGCACFYKRWLTSQKEYKCKDGKKRCIVRHDDPIAVRCKFCRLLGCFKAGLPSDEAPSDPALEQPTERRVEMTEPPPITENFNNFSCGITAVSTLLTKVFSNLHDFEMSTVLKLYQNADFSGNKLFKTERQVLTFLYRRVVPVFISMLCDSIPAFGFIDEPIKTRMAVETQYELHVINEFFMTSIYYPEHDDTRLAVMPGLWADIFGSIDELWFDAEFPENEKPAFLNVIIPYNKSYLRMVNEFRALRLNRMDVCVIMLLALCKFCGNVNDPNLPRSMEKFKDRIVAEYSQNLQKEYGEKSYERLSDVVLLYEKFSKFSIESTHLASQLDLLRSSGAKLAESLPCSQSVYDGKQ